MEEETGNAQTAAANFMEQYTDEDFYLLQGSPDRLKAHIQAVCLSAMQFAEVNIGQEIKIKPGMPDQPSKPRV